MQKLQAKLTENVSKFCYQTDWGNLRNYQHFADATCCFLTAGADQALFASYLLGLLEVVPWWSQAHHGAMGVLGSDGDAGLGRSHLPCWALTALAWCHPAGQWQHVGYRQWPAPVVITNKRTGNSSNWKRIKKSCSSLQSWQLMCTSAGTNGKCSFPNLATEWMKQLSLQ